MSEGKSFLLSINSAKIKFGLDRTNALLQACSNPHTKLYSIQIVGTNGKGSTSAMLANALSSKKIKIGHFTSPHLIDLTERIRINNTCITNQYIDHFINNYKDTILNIGASFFEIMSVMAMQYFVDNDVDVAILETGLGGRLDSISAMHSRGLLFTSISMDHMNILGNSIETIAREKAGAITKHTQWIVSTSQENAVIKILNKYAKNQENLINYIYSDYYFNDTNICKNLPGKHQIQNANLAYAALQILCKELTIFNRYQFKKRLILDTYWPGRIQKIHSTPDIIFDVAHNIEGIDAFNKYFNIIQSRYKKKYLVIGFESTKNINKILNQLVCNFDCIIITETQIKSSMSAELIYESIINKNNIIVNKNAYKAITNTKNKASKSDVIVILGSHYFGNVLNNIFKNCFDNQDKA